MAFTLSGYLGGFQSQGDNAVLTATFLGVGGVSLGSDSIGPVSNSDRSGVTGLFFRNDTGFVPIGTRTIRINLTMTRTDGTYNDGYADNLSLVFTPSVVPEPPSVVLCGVACVFGLVVDRYRKRPSAGLSLVGG